MNRLLSTLALLLSACALVVTLLLWREVSLLRLNVSQHPIHECLSDDQLAVVQGWVDYNHAQFAAGTVPQSYMLMAERLLTKARYMHGDISQEEWHRLNVATGPAYVDLVMRRLKAGAGTPPEVSIYYEDLLESSR